MSLFKNGIPFPIGETIIGKDSDNLVNESRLGQQAWVTHEDIVQSTGLMLFTKAVQQPTLVRIMRNITGSTLAAGELVTINHASGAPGLAEASGLATAGEPNAVVVDPLLGANTVADDDLFLAFVQGPAKVKFPDAGITLGSAGLLFAAGASGRAALAAATASSSRTVLGTLLVGSEANSANQAALRDCLLHPACMV